MAFNNWSSNCLQNDLKMQVAIFQNSVFCLINETSLQRYKFKFSIEKVKSFDRTKQFCIL